MCFICHASTFQVLALDFGWFTMRGTWRADKWIENECETDAPKMVPWMTIDEHAGNTNGDNENYARNLTWLYGFTGAYLVSSWAHSVCRCQCNWNWPPFVSAYFHFMPQFYWLNQNVCHWSRHWNKQLETKNKNTRKPHLKHTKNG